ncbi:SixA phosphatase family protein [Urechidicola vernalis]|uniref:Phosphoglycerate mutase family protein n=1 Tax=Urechidicola vernalis TaxID=3075600 RepID=A0ABU2Y1X3_9FLAO|nr:phosphoglycerate mutase family protein [Urechidicola sp. P050]MDT0552187.1 phosphoglycerate mutase family protein [Urechidicola sp. P050]
MQKLLLTLIVVFSLNAINAQENSTDETTTYYLVRHAEKDLSDKTNRDPALTEIGHARAKNLVKVLQEVKFDAVYSTDYKRTRDTAKPLAEANNLDLQLYNPRNIDYQGFQEKTKGQTVLIVGHSNTTPYFSNGLLGKEAYENLDESIYNNLYIVTVTNGVATSMVLKID